MTIFVLNRPNIYYEYFQTNFSCLDLKGIPPLNITSCL